MLERNWRHFIIGMGADDGTEVTIVVLKPTIMGMDADYIDETKVKTVLVNS